MAFNQGLAPFTWVPTSADQMGPNAPIPGTMVPGGEVRAGDWCQLLISYPSGLLPVAYQANRFLIHCLYTPNSDDATPHEDQMTTYGGSAANRRRTYRIDPGVTFQVPFDGQISVIAGDISDPRVQVQVLLNRGFRPRDKSAEALHQEAEMIRQVEEMADVAVFGIPIQEPGRYDTRSLSPTGLYPPPVVGSPQLVHATWVDIPINTPIPFPDGAEFVEVVNDTGIAGSPTRLVIAALGNALALNCASGILRTIGPFGQGNACVGGVPATWSSPVPLQTLTVWSRLGG